MDDKRLDELEEWINGYDEPISRQSVADIFYDLRSDIEYWQGLADERKKEIEYLRKQVEE